MMVAAWARTFLLMVGGAWGFLLLQSCSGGDGGAPATPSANARQNVMVIDDGIDLTAAELHGKVIASFTHECPRQPDTDTDTDTGVDGGVDGDAGGSGGSAPTFEDRKREYLASLMVPSPCHLRPGIDAKPAPFASVRRYRDRWNAMLRQQRYVESAFTELEWNELEAALDAEYRAFDFHGTTTAGTIAHANAEVRLVLIDRPLGNEQSIEASFRCLNQVDIEQAIALVTDSEVRNAYLQYPTSGYNDEFRVIVAQYNVGIVNTSFGGQARAAIEQMQLERGCAPVTLAAYFSAMGELEHTRSQLIGPFPYLTVQSAGNDGAMIDSPADSADCTPEDPGHLLVGSNDLQNGISTFSNFGACVDVYAPGERVIAPYGRLVAAGPGNQLRGPAGRVAHVALGALALRCRDGAGTPPLSGQRPADDLVLRRGPRLFLFSRSGNQGQCPHRVAWLAGPLHRAYRSPRRSQPRGLVRSDHRSVAPADAEEPPSLRAGDPRARLPGPVRAVRTSNQSAGRRRRRLFATMFTSLCIASRTRPPRLSRTTNAPSTHHLKPGNRLHDGCVHQGRTKINPTYRVQVREVPHDRFPCRGLLRR